jgi:hypothetical protein
MTVHELSVLLNYVGFMLLWELNGIFWGRRRLVVYTLLELLGEALICIV